MVKALFILLLAACLTPWVSSAGALFMGMALALTLGNPFVAGTKKWTSNLLQIAIIGLGAGMNLQQVVKTGASGFVYTLTGITFTIVAGMLIGRLFRTPKPTSLLIAAGTAICGGSAIAATAVAIRAKSDETSVALGIVFTLNAIALFIFPVIGHALHLDQTQFGYWAALAIHDTSSVVGAGLAYGPKALQLATTVKLTRALWIIPVALLLGYLSNRGGAEEEKKKFKVPWFIFGFVAMSAVVTYASVWAPSIATAGDFINQVGKKLLVVALFLIGAGLSRSLLRSMGAKALGHGVLLWVLVASLTLAAIIGGVIS